MSQVLTKSGVDVNKKISDVLETLYLKLGSREGNQDVICGEILAYTNILRLMGYRAEVKIEILEARD